MILKSRDGQTSDLFQKDALISLYAVQVAQIWLFFKPFSSGKHHEAIG
jgi:hypothetical protein